MPKKKESIYLETSIISAYFDFKKQDPERQKVAKKFWEEILPKYEAIISEIVFGELESTLEKNYRIKFLKFVELLRRIKHMLKYPSPIEQDLDKLRDEMWREAGQDPDRLFELIRERSQNFLKDSGYRRVPSGPNAYKIIRDKGKIKYGEKTK